MSNDAVLRLANEYSEVTLQVIATGAGRRLRLTSLRTGEHVDLDATVLESFTTLDTAAMDRLVTAYTEDGTASAAIGASTHDSHDGGDEPPHHQEDRG